MQPLYFMEQKNLQNAPSNNELSLYASPTRHRGLTTFKEVLRFAMKQNGHGKVTRYDSGNNYVAFVDSYESKPYFIKSPLNLRGRKDRHQLHDEADLVTSLHDTNPPVDLPVLRDMPTAIFGTCIPYVAFERMEGVVIPHKNEDGPLQLTDNERFAIGMKLGEVVCWLSSLKNIKSLPLREEAESKFKNNDWLYYRNFLDTHLPSYPVLTQTAHELALQRDQFFPHGIRNSPLQLIHGDLRPPNMVLREDKQNGAHLHGLLDFGNARLGSVAEEALRPYITLGKECIKGMNRVLAEEGKEVPLEALDWWRSCAAVSWFIWNINEATDPKTYAHFIRELKNFQPDKDWSELEERLPQAA